MAGPSTAWGRIGATGEAYRREVVRRVAARAPAAFALLVVCGAVATVFELLRFPERRWWMFGADAAYWTIAGMSLAIIRRRPQASVHVMIVVSIVLGLILNAYHAIVGAQVAMCVWTLTALMASTAVLLPWGWRAEALASIGVVVGYPLMLHGGEDVALAWGADMRFQGQTSEIRIAMGDAPGRVRAAAIRRA